MSQKWIYRFAYSPLKESCLLSKQSVNRIPVRKGSKKGGRPGICGSGRDGVGSGGTLKGGGGEWGGRGWKGLGVGVGGKE